MKKVRVFPKPLQNHGRNDLGPSNCIVFCEKSTGLAQFRAAADATPNDSVERLAGTLAIQCLVRGSEPGDFAVLIPAGKVFANRLVSRAKELLEEGRALAVPMSLSPRQKEILRSVIRNATNKEIASTLNITVRTVKFHISSLLAKFGAENRAELARRATSLVRPAIVEDAARSIEFPSEISGRPELKPLALSAVNTTLRIASRAQSLRFRGPVLPA